MQPTPPPPPPPEAAGSAHRHVRRRAGFDRARPIVDVALGRGECDQHDDRSGRGRRAGQRDPAGDPGQFDHLHADREWSRRHGHALGHGDGECSAAPAAAAKPKPPTVTISSAEILSREAQDIYFDYDMSDLRADAVRAATANAELLKRIFAQDSGFTVLIEGTLRRARFGRVQPGSGRSPGHQPEGLLRPARLARGPDQDHQLRQGKAGVHGRKRGVLSEESARPHGAGPVAQG